MQISRSKHFFFTGNMTSCLHRKRLWTACRPQSRICLRGRRGAIQGYYGTIKSMNGKCIPAGNHLLICFSCRELPLWDRERMAGDAWTGRQEGKLSRTTQSESVNERRNAEEGVGHTNAPTHLIIALSHVLSCV